MLDGGKRLRPIIGTAFCNRSGSNGNGCNFHNSKLVNNWDLLAIVEIIHNASLILDDTPQMDNDSMRRNSPAFHVKYGIKTTYLFCYYLISWINKYLAKRESISVPIQSKIVIIENVDTIFK